MTDIGTRIKDLRLQRGLSLNDAARRAKMSKPGLWQIEEGITSPTLRSLDKIAQGYNVSVSELVDGPMIGAK
jgi:XRE family transcriptional regulator, regulator of sulfur utilization